MTENEPFTRRSVLKASATALGGLGATGIATADVTTDVSPNDFVKAPEQLNGYDECPGESYVWNVEQGWKGVVKEVCTDKYGNDWAKVTWECSETWTVDASKLESTGPIYC